MEKNEEEEVKEMRLTFEGFELVCAVDLSLAPHSPLEPEIRQLRSNEDAVSVPCEIQRIPVPGAHETRRQPVAPTSGSCKG